MKKRIDDLLHLLDRYELVKAVSGAALGLQIENVVTDSRYVVQGSLFVCKGNGFKPEYLGEAIKKGAVSYISEEIYSNEIPCISVTDVRKALSIASRWYYDFSGDDMSLVGVTGTKGKTSTSYILKTILDAEKSNNTALFSTVGVEICNEFHVTHLTTPESIDVQRYYKEAKDAGCHNVVMEVSSQAMKYDRLYGQDFSIGIFLNIDRDHIGENEHANMEEYLNCKIAFLKKCNTVIINKQTKHLKKILSAVKGRNIILIGRDDKEADVNISHIKRDESGSTFTLTYDGMSLELTTNMIGDFNIDNISAAVVAALKMNVSTDTIKKAVTDIHVPGRMMFYKHKGIDIVVDYAHNKLSVQNLYKTVVDEFKPKKIISVFGCSGERSKVRRKDLGTLADEYSDVIYLTADDPGNENVMDICDEIKTYIERPCYEIEDREEAVIRALNSANSGEAVIIYGKGMDDSQRVNGVFIPYKSDVLVVEEWMKENI